MRDSYLHQEPRVQQAQTAPVSVDARTLSDGRSDDDFGLVVIKFSHKVLHVPAKFQPPFPRDPFVHLLVVQDISDQAVCIVHPGINFARVQNLYHRCRRGLVDRSAIVRCPGGLNLVVDNTEGIGAAAHVLAIHGFGADVGADAEPVLVVDLGGGQFDGVPDWCSTHAPHCTVLIADPFQRTPDHNEQVRTACQDTMVHTPLKWRQ